MKYRTKESAIDNVKLFFSTHPSDDIIPIQDAFIAWGRNPDDIEGNKAWFSNKMTHLKYHNLVKPVYALKNGKRVLDKIQLTMEGKRALGRIEGGTDTEIQQTEGKNGHPKISLEDMMREIPRLRKENPGFNITLSVMPKEG